MLLEAMSMQLPVIATDLAGIPEVVIDGETGYLTPPGEVEKFSDAIEMLWANREICRSMGRNARKLVQDKMDKRHQFNAFLNFFRQITE